MVAKCQNFSNTTRFPIVHQPAGKDGYIVFIAAIGHLFLFSRSGSFASTVTRTSLGGAAHSGHGIVNKITGEWRGGGSLSRCSRNRMIEAGNDSRGVSWEPHIKSFKAGTSRSHTGQINGASELVKGM